MNRYKTKKIVLKLELYNTIFRNVTDLVVQTKDGQCGGIGLEESGLIDDLAVFILNRERKIKKSGGINKHK